MLPEFMVLLQAIKQDATSLLFSFRLLSADVMTIRRKQANNGEFLTF